MISILKPQEKVPTFIVPTVLRLKLSDSVSTQCNFFLKYTKDTCTQTAKNGSSASSQCSIYEYKDLASPIKRTKHAEKSCQTLGVKRNSVACQVPDEGAGHPVIETAVYLLKSMAEFQNLQYHVGEDYIYLFSVSFEEAATGTPKGAVTIYANGTSFLNRPFLETVKTQLSLDKPVAELLTLFREVNRPVTLCSGVSCDVQNSLQQQNVSNRNVQRAPGCIVWHEKTVRNIETFVCALCKNYSKNLKRKMKRELISRGRGSARLKANSNYQISYLSPENLAARIKAIRRSKLSMARKLNRLQLKLKVKNKK